jgi:DoxX-like family
VVAEASAHLGYQNETTFHIGIVLLVCVIIYAIPQTSVFGAILLTGYLGGAVATHTRIGDPLFSHILAPTYIGAVLWLGLYLRDTRYRSAAFVSLRGLPALKADLDVIGVDKDPTF